MRLKKGDLVKILAGKDRNKTGRILNVDTKKKKIMVEGLNIYKKHSRPKKQGEKGETVQVVRPLNWSNVLIVCSSCNKAVRVGFRYEAGNKFRFCKKCNAHI